MNAKQDNKLAMYRAVMTVLSGSPTLVARIPKLATKSATLKTKVDQLDQLGTTQAFPTGGVAEDRDQTLEAMADAAMAVAGAVKSYASEHSLGDLAARVTASASAFHYGRQQARLRLARQIHEAASGVVAALADYGVTAETLTDLEAKIAAATGAVSAPRGAVTSRVAATQGLELAFDEIDALLDDEIDPLLLVFKASDPAFYRDYHAARIIIDRPGGRAGTPAATPAAPVATTAAA